LRAPAGGGKGKTRVGTGPFFMENAGNCPNGLIIVSCWVIINEEFEWNGIFIEDPVMDYCQFYSANGVNSV
jgi:hypothetical protein